MRFILRILANALAIYLAAYFIPGVTVSSGDWKTFLIAGVVLAIINAVLKPILKLISLPLIFVTLGLFSFSINGFIILLITQIVPQLNITGIIALALTSIVVSFANFIVNFLTKRSHTNVD